MSNIIKKVGLVTSESIKKAGSITAESLHKMKTSLTSLPQPLRMPSGSIGIITSQNKLVILKGFQSILQNSLTANGVTFPIRNIYIAPQTTLSISTTPNMTPGTNLVVVNGMNFKGNKPLLLTEILKMKKVPLNKLFPMFKNMQHVIINSASVNSEYAVSEPFSLNTPMLSITNLLILIMIIILLVYACQSKQ